MGHVIEARRFGAAVEGIYAAAVDPESWPAALAGLADLFSGAFVDIFTRSHDREYFNGLAHGLDRADYDDVFLGFWFKRNIWVESRPVRVAGEVLSTRQIADVSALRRSEIFNEYLDPRGLHEGLRLSLWVDEHEIQDVSILRPWSLGAYGPAEVALGKAVLPHLQRAAAVTRRLRHAALRHEIGAEGRASGGFAVFTFDRDGVPFWFNAAAEAMLADGSVLHIQDGDLRAAAPATNRALQQAVAGATGRAAGCRSGRVVPLPSPGPAPPLNLVVLPLSASVDWAMARPPAAVAYVRDPAALTLPEESLRHLFALTPSETELARHLLARRSLREVSERSGRSFNTLRSHLAHLMVKTGTRRQSDLVRLLADIATLGPASGRVAGGDPSPYGPGPGAETRGRDAPGTPSSAPQPPSRIATARRARPLSS